MMSVTIVVPAFNAAAYIGETIASIARQTYRDWHCIVVDDGSTDGTAEAVQRGVVDNGLSEDWVSVLRLSRNSGVSVARNNAIRAATAPILALVDADDIWLPDHLAVSIETLRSSGADLVAGRILRFETATGNITDTWGPYPGWVDHYGRLLFEGFSLLNPSTWVYKAHLHNSLGFFDESLHGTEDMEFLIRMAVGRRKIVTTSQPTVRYRLHAAQATRNSAKMNEFVAAALGKHAGCGLLPRDVILDRVGYFAECSARGYLPTKPLRAARMFWKSWIARKRQVRLLAHAFRAIGLSAVRATGLTGSQEER